MQTYEKKLVFVSCGFTKTSMLLKLLFLEAASFGFKKTDACFFRCFAMPGMLLNHF